MEIDKNNVEIWKLFLSISNQFRISSGVIFALDYTPIFLLARELNIEIDDIFIDKLKAYEKIVLDIIKNGSDSFCNNEEKEKCKILYGGNFDWACSRCKKNPKNKNRDKK
jgi:hypothetical protein